MKRANSLNVLNVGLKESQEAAMVSVESLLSNLLRISYIHQGCIYSWSVFDHLFWYIKIVYCEIIWFKMFSIWYILKWNLFIWWQRWIVSIITPVFSVTWSFRYQFWYIDLELNKHFISLSLLKTVIYISCGNWDIFFSGFFDKIFYSI